MRAFWDAMFDPSREDVPEEEGVDIPVVFCCKERYSGDMGEGVVLWARHAQAEYSSLRETALCISCLKFTLASEEVDDPTSDGESALISVD